MTASVLDNVITFVSLCVTFSVLLLVMVAAAIIVIICVARKKCRRKNLSTTTTGPGKQSVASVESLMLFLFIVILVRHLKLRCPMKSLCLAIINITSLTNCNSDWLDHCFCL